MYNKEHIYMNSIDVFTRYDDQAGCFSDSDKLKYI